MVQISTVADFLIIWTTLPLLKRLLGNHVFFFLVFFLEGQYVYWKMYACVCMSVCVSVCVFVGGGRGGPRGRCGLLPVCVLSTLPSAKSLPMPLWFYLLYDFLVNFIFYVQFSSASPCQ